MTGDESLMLTIKRIYDPPAPDDGTRLLVDRLWPRGLSKERAAIDEWIRDIAPSPELRKQFNHRPERFAEFTLQYETELLEDPVKSALVTRIRQMASTRPVTLLYAAKNPVHNHAVVLRNWIMNQGF